MKIKHLILSSLVMIFISFCFWTPSFAIEIYSKMVVSAEDTWIDISVPGRGTTGGPSGLSLSIKPNNSVMTIRLQRKYEEEITWDHNVEFWNLTTASKDIECNLDPEPVTVTYRLGCSSGNYTSGSAALRLGTGWK